MKTASRILMLMAAISFMSCGQLHVVTLYVDTAQIDESNSDLYAHFGQPEGISNKDYTIYVRRGDRVIWNGVSISNPSDEVNVTSIVNKPGEDYQGKPYVNLFKDKYAIGVHTTSASSTKNIKGIVRRAIKNGKPGDIQKYSLKFTINDMEQEIEVDPKMKMYY